MPAIPHGRFAAPTFRSASRDGFYFDPNVPPIDPPVFDQGRQFAETFLDLHRSGRLSGLPAGETPPKAFPGSTDVEDFGFSTKPNPGEVLLRMETARKRFAPTSPLSEFAMRARADGGVGAGVDPALGAFLFRLGRAREQAAASEGAEDSAFTIHADGEAGVGAGPELGLALLRFAASGDRHSPTDERKAPSITPPAATPVSSNGQLPTSGTENGPRVPGAYNPAIDTSPRQRDDLHIVDRLDRGVRYYLGPHLYRGISNVLEVLPNVTVPRDVGQSIGETGQAIEDRDVLGVVRGIGNIGLSALGVAPVKSNLNVRAPACQASRRQPAPEGRTPEPQPRNDTGSNRPDNTPSPVGTKVAQEPHYPGARVSKRKPNAPKRLRPRRNNLWMGGELETTDGWLRADYSPLGNANPYRLDHVKRVHAATIGKSELNITFDIDRRKKAIEVKVGFGVDEDDLQTLVKGREWDANFREILATVHNKMMNVIEQEVGKQRPVIVKFQPATPKLEKVYRVFGKRVGEDELDAKFYVKELPFAKRHVRGAKSRHAPSLTVKKRGPTFVYEFPENYVFPDQY